MGPGQARRSHPLSLVLPYVVQHLAKELVRSRKAVNRMHEQKAQINSVILQLGENVGEHRFLLLLKHNSFV